MSLFFPWRELVMDFSLSLSQPTSLLYFLPAVQLRRGVTEWIWWILNIQTGSTHHMIPGQISAAAVSSPRQLHLFNLNGNFFVIHINLEDCSGQLTKCARITKNLIVSNHIDSFFSSSFSFSFFCEKMFLDTNVRAATGPNEKPDHLLSLQSFWELSVTPKKRGRNHLISISKSC